MPFSDLLRMTKGKTDFTTHQKTSPFSTDLSSSGGGGDADFYELVWENGQIVMQGQSSSRARKAAPTSSDLLSKQPTITDVKDANSSKMAKSGTMNHHTFPLSVTSCETALNHQDEELVPWLNYPLLESLNNEYCSGLLPELSGVTENGLSSARNSTQPSSLAVTVDQSRTATNNALSSRPDNASKAIPRAGGVSQAKRGDHLGNANGMDQYTSSIQYCPSQTGGSASMNFSDKHEDRHQPSSYMNFSYLSRLASTPGPGNNNRNPVSITGGLTCRTQRFGSNNYDKGGALSSSTPTVSNIIHNPTVGCSRPAGDFTCRTGVSLPAVNNVANESKAPNHPVRKDSYLPPQQLGGVYIEDNVRNHNSSKQSPGAVTEGEKVAEPAVAASSICSRNSLEKDGSNEPGSHLKRKSSETGESESATEDNEEESVGVRVVAAPRAGVKRSRAAEVHNLSERKRREKINEKMRALQELVPNCNKADKASMLDEAIEYLKTLQLQVQMLSMGTGFYIPPMLIPAAMQHIHRAQMSPFPPMPMGMGMGMGFGGLGSMHDLNNSTSMMQQMPSSCYPSLHAAASSPHIPASSSTFHLGYNGFPSSGQLSAPSHSTLPFQVVNPTMKLPISSPHVYGGTDAPSHVAPQSTTQNIMQNGSQVNNLDGSGNGPDNQVSAEATALLNAQPQANINAAHEAQKLAGVNSNNKPN